MPYVNPETRKRIDYPEHMPPRNAGELNYALTQVVQRYLHLGGGTPDYQRYNDALGALEGCKLELYRRRIARYEDEKILQNGDVYR